jgi:CDP-glucose 4,6-dehydratase
MIIDSTPWGVFSGKKVLITGHTGFKGSWLSIWLQQLGANVVGYSLDPPSELSNFEATNLGNYLTDVRGDIRNLEALSKVMQDERPDFFFHLAAQALVRPSYESPLETHSINALGTATVLEALRLYNEQIVVVMITSDKAYDNVEWAWGYRENDRLGGKDPYSASKGMAELAIRSYVDSFFSVENSNVRLAIARAGNVIGGGDWGKDRIVPDCMHSWSKGEIVDIRSPNATRPWQHVLEPLSGYLSLAASLQDSTDKHGESYNFGPKSDISFTVEELINNMMVFWDNVRWKDVSDSDNHVHEAGLLKLNCDKALMDLNWAATLNFDETVRFTVEWYREFYQGNSDSMRTMCEVQIQEYMTLNEKRQIRKIFND